MFEKSAEFYDLIYQWKDYVSESSKLHAFIQQHKQSDGNRLLDVACGTGAHIPYLRDHYQIEGLDLDEGMLKVARERHPDVPFHVGDMRDFDLGKRYDGITCLFAAIAYNVTLDDLQRTLRTFYQHLKPGGVVLVDGFIQLELWRDNHIHAMLVDEPDFKITRMNRSERDGNAVTLNFHYLVGTPESIDYFTEQHTMTLFSDDEYLGAFRGAGLEATVVANGLMPERGLFIGVRPLT